MNKDWKSLLELISFLEINEGDHLLELTDGHYLIAPILKSSNVSLDYTIDLCLLKHSMSVSEAVSYYEHIFFMPALEGLKPSYDSILIPTSFNELIKNEGIHLLQQLVRRVKKNIYLVINDELRNNTWILHDFKDFDLSFFTLATTQQKLIKIYPSSEIKELEYLPLVSNDQKLSILYVVPHRNLTGGLKMLYEQMKALQKRGHKITVMIRGNYEKVIPDWVEDFVPDHQLIIKLYDSYKNYLQGIDIIFAGFYNQIEELKNEQVPVLYWEQGHEYLYGDVNDKNQEQLIRQSLIHQFNQDIYYATDSNYVHDLVKARFHRESYVLPIFIDTDFYYPKEKKNDALLTVLLVGNPILAFKGFTKALQVLVNAWSQGLRFKVSWACQVQPQTTPLPFEINYFVNVSQQELASIYRESDILLSCSLYEGCPMPPLEAMASGVAVVATNSGGINQYAIHQENALIATSNTVNELTRLLETALVNKDLREKIIKNGRLTAMELNYENGAKLLEQILQSVTSDYKSKQKMRLKQHPKKVLFMIGTLLAGGAEKVLCNLVKKLDPNQFEITVQTVFDQGVYIEEVKKYVTYKTIFKSTASNELEAKQLMNHYQYLASLDIDAFSRAVITQPYDIEVAFLEDQSTRIIAHSPNQHSRKIAWVHADLIEEPGSLQFYKDLTEQTECYQKFDDIVCVSKGVQEAFIKKFNINSNYHIIYNPIDREEILRKSQEKLEEQWESSTFKVLAVGRLVPQKGFQRLLQIHQKLIKEGYDYELWIIGDGILKESLTSYITQNQLENHTKLLGFQSNPYKYMAASDLFISCSETEGFSLVIAEALVIGLPVITTNCSGPLELIGNNEYGWVVNNDEASIYEGLKFLLTHTIEYMKYKERSHHRGNMFNLHEVIEQVEALLLSEKNDAKLGDSSPKTN